MSEEALVDGVKSIYVDGTWAASSGRDAIPVIDPATEETLAYVPAGTADDVTRAVTAARLAVDEWGATPASERGALLAKIADALETRAEEMARTISRDMGAPLSFAMQVQTRLPIGVLRSYAELARTYEWTERVGHSLVVREPAGVVTAITPWNYPLHQVVAKLAPALAAGCAVVLKPSEVAPLAAYLLFEVLDTVGLPPGVVNLVSGSGPVVGEALADHPDVDVVSFTGSTRAGQRVMELASRHVSRVALELGGKSPNVLLPDLTGDLLVRAVKVGVANAFLNSGQTCSAWSRMLVCRDSYDEAVRLAASAAQGYRVGDPLATETRLGPLVSATQRARVRRFVETGIAEGARLVAGGTAAPLERGFFVAPTVFADVDPEMTIAQEEIFGPVLSMLRYDDVAEAVAIANGTAYGLSAGVWSADRDAAVAVARRIRSGQVDVGGARFNLLAPFGGYKRSGIGRELGRHGLEEFTEVKSIQL